MDHTLHVQHAVRHAPVTVTHGDHVMRAVRHAQAERAVVDAALRAAQASAMPDHSLMSQPFALGTPNAPRGAEEVPREAAPSEAAPERTSPTPADAPATRTEPPRAQPKAAEGLRAQIGQLAKDRKTGSRPLTRPSKPSVAAPTPGQ
jgi:hypothetical protein